MTSGAIIVLDLKACVVLTGYLSTIFSSYSSPLIVPVLPDELLDDEIRGNCLKQKPELKRQRNSADGRRRTSESLCEEEN